MITMMIGPNVLRDVEQYLPDESLDRPVML